MQYVTGYERIPEEEETKVEDNVVDILTLLQT